MDGANWGRTTTGLSDPSADDTTIPGTGTEVPSSPKNRFSHERVSGASTADAISRDVYFDLIVSDIKRPQQHSSPVTNSCWLMRHRDFVGVALVSADTIVRLYLFVSPPIGELAPSLGRQRRFGEPSSTANMYNIMQYRTPAALDPGMREPPTGYLPPAGEGRDIKCEALSTGSIPLHLLHDNKNLRLRIRWEFCCLGHSPIPLGDAELDQRRRADGRLCEAVSTNGLASLGGGSVVLKLPWANSSKEVVEGLE
ncbi:hypothetical protein F4781DRAFT_430043 [Annulohypoxylon bovei var. microspora]|nr:hypothetical protein F4781DRAFT_430043 [Annulohypoxylon bovei var. microspora]